jgi:hypothetical protein
MMGEKMGRTVAQQRCVLKIESSMQKREKERNCQQLPVVVFWLPPPEVM